VSAPDRSQFIQDTIVDKYIRSVRLDRGPMVDQVIGTAGGMLDQSLKATALELAGQAPRNEFSQVPSVTQ
jgi:hypothetical protein